jgi:hypothetical protein
MVSQSNGYLTIEEAVELTGGRISLQGSHSGVAVVSQWCYKGVTLVLHWCYTLD